jgi:hypothetical protein
MSKDLISGDMGAGKNLLSNFCRKQKIEPTEACKALLVACIPKMSQLNGKGVCMTSAALRQVARRHRTHYLISLVKNKVGTSRGTSRSTSRGGKEVF